MTHLKSHSKRLPDIRHQKTKLIGTIGPASESEEMLRRLMLCGLDIFRLNFSHGNHGDHSVVIERIRRVSTEFGIPVTIFCDLQGPKLRTGTFREHQPLNLTQNQLVTIRAGVADSDGEWIATPLSELPAMVSRGSRILISDGALELRVIDIQDMEIHCAVEVGGSLGERQGINLPGMISTPVNLTEKDRSDLKFCLTQEIDYIALSFVRSPDDIRAARHAMDEWGHRVPIIAKIERPEAVDNLKDVVAEADALMVARGDLGVEIRPENVPMVQKRIIAECRRVGKPVITATQMLESMIHSSRPTRAEASDVANAILDGSDAVMLSGETAIGQYPVEAVEMLARIADEVEMTMTADLPCPYEISRLEHPDSASAYITEAVAAVAARCACRAIAVFTRSGATARLMAQHRPSVPIFAFTHDPIVFRRMNLLWGIRPVLVKEANDLRMFESIIRTELLASEDVRKGDRIAITGGHPIAQQKATNFLKLIEL